jgi:hypothetical protein
LSNFNLAPAARIEEETSMLRLTAVAVFTLIGAGLSCANLAAAGPLAPTKASQLVTLFTSGGTFCGGGGPAGQGRLVDQQTDPSGNSHTFQIPTGQVLIVTSGTIQIASGLAGSSVTLFIEEFGAGGGGGNPVHGSSLVLDSNGSGHTDFVLNPGVIVKAIASSPVQGLCADTQGAPNAVINATLHGFLAPDK